MKKVKTVYPLDDSKIRNQVDKTELVTPLVFMFNIGGSVIFNPCLIELLMSNYFEN